MNLRIYNLEEFASQYHLKDIFGAYAAHLSVTILENMAFKDMVTERVAVGNVSPRLSKQIIFYEHT